MWLRDTSEQYGKQGYRNRMIIFGLVSEFLELSSWNKNMIPVTLYLTLPHLTSAARCSF